MGTDSVDQLRIPNKAALAVYCDQVACSVGRLSNNVFGIEPLLGKKLALTEICSKMDFPRENIQEKY